MGPTWGGGGGREPGKGVRLRVRVKIVGGGWGSLVPEFNLDLLWTGVGVRGSQTWARSSPGPEGDRVTSKVGLRKGRSQLRRRVVSRTRPGEGPT